MSDYINAKNADETTPVPCVAFVFLSLVSRAGGAVRCFAPIKHLGCLTLAGFATALFLGGSTLDYARTSPMLSALHKIMTRRSMPSAQPEDSGNPLSSAAKKASGSG